MLKTFVIPIIFIFSFLVSIAETREDRVHRPNQTVIADESRAGDTGDISSIILSRQLDLVRGPQPNARAVEQHGFLDALPPFFEKFTRGGSLLARHYQATHTPILRQQLQLIYPHHDFW